MGKLPPDELWRKHVTNHFIALKQSGELERLREKGLAICGRKRRYSSKEWSLSFSKRYSSKDYRGWVDECEAVGQRFGLAFWTVVCACLVSGYKPEKEPFPVEAQWPSVRIVTKSNDSDFLIRLAYEAQKLGLHVVQRQGSVENAHLFASPVPICQLEPPSMPSSLPPLADALYVRVETPIGYPPEAGCRLQKEAGRLGKEIAKRLGYPVQQRLRSSRLVSMASTLRIGETLSRGEAYDIVDDVYEHEDLDDDQKRRKLVASRRHRLRKRLIEPYQSNGSNKK